MSVFLTLYENNHMVNGDYAYGTDRELVVTEGLGDIIGKIFDKILAAIKWVINKLKDLYNRIKTTIRKLLSSKGEELKAAKEKQAENKSKESNQVSDAKKLDKEWDNKLDKLKNDEKAAAAKQSEDKKKLDDKKKVFDDKTYYRKNEPSNDEKAKEFGKSLKLTEKEIEDHTNKYMAQSKNKSKEEPKTSPAKQVSLPKVEPKDLSFEVEHLMFDYDHGVNHGLLNLIDMGIKSLTIIGQTMKNRLNDVKFSTSDPDKGSASSDKGDPLGYRKVVKDELDRMKEKFEEIRNGDYVYSKKFNSTKECSKFLEDNMAKPCQQLWQVYSKIYGLADEVADKYKSFRVAIDRKYNKAESLNLTENETAIKQTLNAMKTDFGEISKDCIECYKFIAHDYKAIEEVLIRKMA